MECTERNLITRDWTARVFGRGRVGLWSKTLFAAREKNPLLPRVLMTDDDLFLVTRFNRCWLTKMLKGGLLEKRNSSFITVAECHSFTI